MVFFSFLQDIDLIFSNITDIYEFSVTFLGLLDAAIEVADEGKQPAIGECFEEMAEVDHIAFIVKNLVKVKNPILPTRRPTHRSTHHQHTTDTSANTLPTR